MNAKTITFLSLAVVACSFASCRLDSVRGSGNVTTQTRHVPAFHSVNLSFDGDVELIPSPTFNVEIITDDNLQQYILVDWSDSTIHIRKRDHTWIRRQSEMRARVYLPELLRLQNACNGDVSNTGTLTLRNRSSIDIDANGNTTLNLSGNVLTLTNHQDGRLNLTLNADELQITSKANGNSTFVLDTDLTYGTIENNGVTTFQGATDNFTITNKSNGYLNARYFSADKVILTNSANGSVDIYANDEISIQHTGNGNVYYYGNAWVRSLIDNGNGVVQHR